MDSKQKLLTFTRYAWFALAYNLVVILWGVFLRASYSGDGCGQHWLTCQGEAIPSAPELKTVIEFSHRITTMLAGLVVLVLLIWAFRRFQKGHIVRKFAALSFVFILIEGAIGGGLVLTGNTAANWTPSRPFWTAGHLINTFILIAFLALTAWFSGHEHAERRPLSARDSTWIAVGLASILIVGISGSMAALSTMLFPSGSVAEGIARDFDPDSHLLLRLRLLHPILSIFAAVYLVLFSGFIRRKAAGSPEVVRWSKALSILIVVQIVFGAATLLMLGPIVMQLGHLLLADLVWIAFVLLGASFITDSSAREFA
jgi:heme A synthase